MVTYFPKPLNKQVAAISDSLTRTQEGLGIGASGDTHDAISSGQFVYVRDHSSLAEGLYKSTAAIAANGALSTSNLTADESGGLNDLQSQITSLNSNLSNVLTNTDLRSFAKSVRDGFTCFRYNNTVTNIPTQYGHGYIVKYGVNIRIVVFAMQLNETYTSYSYDSGTSWTNWDSYALNSKIANINKYIPSSFGTSYDGVFNDIGQNTGSRYDIMEAGATNTPTSAYALCITVKRVAGAGSTVLGTQVAITVGGTIYKRTYANSAWSNWSTIG